MWGCGGGCEDGDWPGKRRHRGDAPAAAASVSPSGHRAWRADRRAVAATTTYGVGGVEGNAAAAVAAEEEAPHWQHALLRCPWSASALTRRRGNDDGEGEDEVDAEPNDPSDAEPIKEDDTPAGAAVRRGSWPPRGAPTRRERRRCPQGCPPRQPAARAKRSRHPRAESRSAHAGRGSAMPCSSNRAVCRPMSRGARPSCGRSRPAATTSSTWAASRPARRRSAVAAAQRLMHQRAVIAAPGR